MKAFHQSIRWRIQAWYGLLLLVVLAGFGAAAWWLARDNQLAHVDTDLRLRMTSLGSAIFSRGFSSMSRKSSSSSRFTKESDTTSPQELRRSPGQRYWFGEQEGGYYYVVWTSAGEVRYRSTNAPADIPYPDAVTAGSRSQTRQRDQWRERYFIPSRGYTSLVGVNLEAQLAAGRKMAWQLIFAGGGILALGLGFGWWLSGRALKPIGEISAAARHIAGDRPAERINLTHGCRELVELSAVLNETFDRLQGAVTRQMSFTADASHELRTPVAVVLTQIQAALKRPRAPEEYRDTLHICERAIQRMRDLIESLLLLARQDSPDATPRREPCQLQVIVDEAVTLFGIRAAERQARIVQQIEPVEFTADARQIVQVITNLLSNAIDYSPPAATIQVAGGREGANVVLTVTDTGPGIAAEDLPHIFERFYRADKSRTAAHGHNGLGLAITRGIVQAHGGTIEVTSRLGEGTRFTVRLPAGAARNATDEPAPEPVVMVAA